MVLRTLDVVSDPTEPPESLDELRVRIDELDRRIVELLNERARVVVRVGELKREHAIPIYAPHRERAVLDRAIANC